MPRRSRPSGRLSTTSPRTNKPKTLGQLIDALPPERAASAFTHASWAEDRVDSYERLEFLGDSVLELALAHELYTRFPDYDEGQMAKIRSAVVSRASCAIVAHELALGDRLVAEATDPTVELARLASNTQRPGRGARIGARRPLSRARLRADRARDRRGLQRADRVRAEQPGRPQDRASGAARPGRPERQLRAPERRGAAARPHLHLRGRDRRRGGWGGPWLLEEGRRAECGPRGACAAGRPPRASALPDSLRQACI